MSEQRKPLSRHVLGHKISRARTAAGLTQGDLAARVDLAPNSVYRIEAGRVLPSLTAFRALAIALNVSADELLGIGR